MLTPSTNRLTINVIGAIAPCHSPPQKPAGSAPRSLYLEFHPATEREFGMEASKYIKRTPSRATDAVTRNGRQPNLCHRCPLGSGATRVSRSPVSIAAENAVERVRSSASRTSPVRTPSLRSKCARLGACHGQQEVLKTLQRIELDSEVMLLPDATYELNYG